MYKYWRRLSVWHVLQPDNHQQGHHLTVVDISNVWADSAQYGLGGNLPWQFPYCYWLHTCLEGLIGLPLKHLERIVKY